MSLSIRIENGVYVEPALDPYSRATRAALRFIGPCPQIEFWEGLVEEARYATRSGPVTVLRSAREA